VGDGIDQDCDSVDLCYVDADDDGFGTSATQNGRSLSCEADVGLAAVTGDCDDTAASVRPGATEAIGDGVDQDCDGGEVCLADADGDRFGGTATVDSRDTDCADDGEAGLGGDCDDASAFVNPGAREVVGDALDQDCDGGDTCYADLDGDGFGGADAVVESDDLDCADLGEHAGATDCDDGSVLFSPGAVEQCDPLDRDEDCNGVADDDDVTGAGMPYAVGTIRYWVDADGDGFGSGQPSYTCEEERVPAGAARFGGDCDDARDAVYPGAVETCDATEDLNCDGSFGSADADGDSFPACADCDDTRAEANPSAAETCNGVDDDCDGTVDEPDASDAQAFHLDDDLDGFGDGATAVTACAAPSGYVSNADDCDDADADTHPGAPEVPYDGLDQDCDDGDLCDQDLDGFGACANEDDCDDLDEDAFPGADEILGDGIDQDCDGADALPPDDTGTGTATDTTTSTGTGTDTATGTGSDPGTSTGTGSDTATDEGSDEALPYDGVDEDDEARKAGAFGWLGCATAPDRGAPGGVLGLAMLLALRARRRRD
jgi:MYXO-CTERM domain-containing protein